MAAGTKVGILIQCPINCRLYKHKRKNNPDLQRLAVRTPSKYHEQYLEGAHLIPIDSLRMHIQQLEPQKETVVYCRVGLRGYAQRVFCCNMACTTCTTSLEEY